MRAWQVHQYGEPLEVLRLVEKKVPEPGHGEIRIRVAAASLGLPDVFLCRGVYPTFQPQPPFTPGQEVTGVVTAAGEETHSPVGSRVMAVTAFPGGHGGFADQTLAYDNAVYRVPDEMSDVEAAAFLIQFQTAYIALARPRPVAPWGDPSGARRRWWCGFCRDSTRGCTRCAGDCHSWRSSKN